MRIGNVGKCHFQQVKYFSDSSYPETRSMCLSPLVLKMTYRIILAAFLSITAYSSFRLGNILEDVEEMQVPAFLAPYDLETPIRDLKAAITDFKDIFVNADADLIEELSRVLGMSRDDALDHFIARCRPELDLAQREVADVIEAPNDFVLASLLATGKFPPEILSPIKNVMEDYIHGVSHVCLFDQLPIGLRYPSGYSSAFSHLHKSTISSTANQGILVSLGSESACPDSSFTQASNVVIRSGGFQRTRIFDINAKCAVELMPEYRDIKFLPEQRTVWMVDVRHNAMLVWREDSVEPLRLPTGIDGFTGNSWATADHLFLERRDLENPWFRQRPFMRFVSLPLNIEEPFTARLSNSVQGYQLSRRFLTRIPDATGNIHLLTEEGKARLTLLFKGEPEEVKIKLDKLRSRDVLSEDQRLVLQITEDLSFDSMIHKMRRIANISDLVTLPFHEWLPAYLAILDTISG